MEDSVEAVSSSCVEVGDLCGGELASLLSHARRIALLVQSRA
ncbi:hypothetical protein ACFWVU_00570 [Streptomyces sp. NPDC058686]